MYQIGLTGGIASGKSTVAKILQEMGLSVINLDMISRQILAKGTPGYWKVLAVFGKAILSFDGEIDRKALGLIIFQEPVERKKLEVITHPLILQKMQEEITHLADAGKKVVIVEVPLLIEVGMMDEFDQVWLVYVDEKTQLERLKARDLLDQTGALARLAAQMPLEAKKAYADRIIVNHGEIDDLRGQIDELWRELKCKDLL